MPFSDTCIAPQTYRLSRVFSLLDKSFGAENADEVLEPEGPPAILQD